MVIYYDNHSCIKLFENKVLHERSMNIEILYHFILDRIQKGEFNPHSVSSNDQVVDILEKPLVKGKFYVL
jgi:hypothetical protein